MRRRDLLRTATMTAVLPRAGPRRPSPRDRADAWVFALDADLRWSLVPSEGGEPAVRDAEIAVEFADGAVLPLRALPDARRFRFGERGEPGGWSVIGSAGGVEVTARFVDGRSATAGTGAQRAPWPQIVVALRGLDAERPLAALRLLDTSRARVPALARTGAQGHGRTGAQGERAGPAVLVNGYQSWDACRVVALGEPGETIGHWHLATVETGAPAHRRTGAPTGGLGLAFGPDDSGEGRFLIGPSGVRAVSLFGGRLVGAAYPPALTALTIVPAPNALDILGELAGAARLAPLPTEVPAGWCSWYELYGDVTEADVLASLDVARRAFDRRAFRVIQIDDGFQRAAGDWSTNDKFPHGHRWLTDAIHSAGFEAGLWLAPFAVSDRSGIPLARPEWLLCDARGEPLVVATRNDWGGRIFALDGSQREVQDHLRDLLRHAVGDWGYDYLKLDFLYYGTRGTRAGRWQSGAEAYRAGLRAMREGAGRAYLLGCGAPLQHAVGMFDGMRIGADVDATWQGVQPAASAALHRAHLHRRPWHNDPDALVVRAPLSPSEAQAWTSVVALSGQMLLASDRLERLSPDRLDLLKRTVPVAGVSGRALDLATPERVTAPALYAGTAKVAELPARWRFRAGDDGAWSAPDLDDAAWEQIAVGTSWETAGHPDLDGFAWYRARFVAPRRAPPGPLVLDLGRIDDADQTFMNGTPVGSSGTLPPHYAADWQGYRRYEVPKDVVRWGRENVVAIRVYDGGGPGGWYSLRRGRPPGWILAPVRSDWWMLGALNWDDDPRRMTVDLAAHGVSGPLLVYDVWHDARLSDADGRWSGLVAPRGATVLALRRRTRVPCVIGTTRHIVQGAVDLEGERWDARRKVLSARAVRLDDRPYAVTIALPAGFRAKRCGADVECRLEGGQADRRTDGRADRRTDGRADGRTSGQADERTRGRAPAAGSVRLVFPALAGREISWEVEF